jgi:Uri superfamily endonuclease
LPPSKGVYMLILGLSVRKNILTGKLGLFSFPKGFYIYIGSASGLGGIRGRLKHHFNISVKPHWHIDYLRKEADLVNVFYINSPKELEHALAAKLQTIFNIPILKFGSSDCKCNSHLFFSTENPSLVYMQKSIHPGLQKYSLYE